MEAEEKPPIGAVLEYYHGNPIPTGSHGRAKVRCMYHDDSNASASIDHNKNTFRCFACLVSGDSIEIIRMEEGADFKTAIQLAEERGWIMGDDVSGAASRVLRGSGVFGGAGTPEVHGRSRAARVRRRRRTGA